MTIPVHKRATAIRRELMMADRIPYTAHVAPTVVKTAFGDYLQVFRLGGASFESSDDQQLNNWHERLNVLWRNVANPCVALWTQIIRRRATVLPSTKDASDQRAAGRSFANDLHAKYQRRLSNEILMINEMYLAVVYQPNTLARRRVWSRRSSSEPSATGRNGRSPMRLMPAKNLRKRSQHP